MYEEDFVEGNVDDVEIVHEPHDDFYDNHEVLVECIHVLNEIW